MPHGIECQCCREMDSVQERLIKWEGMDCITNHDQFAVVCLNKDIFYIALVIINRERSECVCLPLSNRYVSLSTVVLNSRDWSEIVWPLEILRFKNQPCNRLYPEKTCWTAMVRL